MGGVKEQQSLAGLHMHLRLHLHLHLHTSRVYSGQSRSVHAISWSDRHTVGVLAMYSVP